MTTDADAEDDAETEADAGADADRDAAQAPHETEVPTPPSSADDTSTAPIDITAFTARKAPDSAPLDEGAAEADALRASEAALRRWRAE